MRSCMFDPSAILGVTTSLTLQLMGAVVAMLAVGRDRRLLLPVPAPGSSGRRCRCRRSRKSSSSPKATRTSRASIRQLRHAAHEEAHDGGGAEGVA